MADKPIENLLYEFLVEKSAELPADFEIHPSGYDERGDYGLFIGDAETSLLPNGNGDSMTEFDAELFLEVFARVEGEDKTDRNPARQKAFDAKLALLQLLEEYPTLQGRGCKVLYLRQQRMFDDTSGDNWAIETIQLVVNPRDYRGS